MNSRAARLRDFSTAAAYALELGVQQLFTFIRRGLDVAVVTVVMAAGEFSSASAKSVTAARIGRECQDAAMKRDAFTMTGRTM